MAAEREEFDEGPLRDDLTGACRVSLLSVGAKREVSLPQTPVGAGAGAEEEAKERGRTGRSLPPGFSENERTPGETGSNRVAEARPKREPSLEKRDMVIC